MQLTDLKEREGWIVFTYPDGSKRYFRTTLNEEVLKSVPGGIVKGKLFDLGKFRWVDLPKSPEVSVDVYEEKPSDVSEVDEFVNRFI